jgi:hypothetical protein
MAPNQITFKIGQMRHFIAARSFALGNTGSTVPKGADVMFDGTKAEVDGGEYALPQLRGAIKAGWLVLAEDFDENDNSAEIPQRANVQVRHAAQGGNPMQPNRAPTHSMATTESDEREVSGSISQHASDTRERNTGYKRGQAVNASGQKVLGQHGFEVVEDQDGVVIEGRTLKTAAGEKAKRERTTLTVDRVGAALRQATTSGVITPGQGITEEEMLERLSEEERAEYLAKKESLRAQYVDDEPPRKVGKVKTQKQANSEGIRVTTSVGGGVEIADPTGAGGKPKESVIVQDGITFRNTNGPQKDVRATPKQDASPVILKDGSAETDIRRQVAKTICPDFPANYMFDQPARKKLARLQADYEDRPDVIRAVFAAESDDFKTKLVEEFPQAFGR